MIFDDDTKPERSVYFKVAQVDDSSVAVGAYMSQVPEKDFRVVPNPPGLREFPEAHVIAKIAGTGNSYTPLKTALRELEDVMEGTFDLEEIADAAKVYIGTVQNMGIAIKGINPMAAVQAQQERQARYDEKKKRKVS